MIYKTLPNKMSFAKRVGIPTKIYSDELLDWKLARNKTATPLFEVT